MTPPNQNALLSGGVTIGVQDVCPGRYVDHIYMVDDAVSFYVMLDALNHDGHADLARVLATTPDLCSLVVAPNMKPGAVGQLEYVINGALQGFLCVEPGL